MYTVNVKTFQVTINSSRHDIYITIYVWINYVNLKHIDVKLEPNFLHETKQYIY